MSNQISKPELSPARVSSLQITLGRIETLKEAGAKLEVSGVKDHKGLKKVVKTRKFIKGIRINTEKRRRELNADMLREMRENNFAARYIINELKPLEKHLFSIEKDIAAKKAAIKKEKELAKEAALLQRLQQRIEALAAYNIVSDLQELKAMNDDDFKTYLAQVHKDWEAVQQLKQQEAQSLLDKNKQLEEENAKLKASVITQPVASPPETETAIPADPVNITIDIPDAYMAMTTDEKATVHQQLKDYVTAIRAVAIPKIKNDQARIIFLHGHSLVNDGCNYILDAIK